ncbi:MAG TPA: porin [Burkholderiaceae bacterium]
MNKSLLALAVLATCSSVAMAQQTNVTLYGDIDAAVRSTTNASATGGRQTSLGNGIFENSFIGFKGMEDLGNGNSALFDLEAGLNIGNGQSSNQGQLFGNQAWVGLRNNSLGELDLGRQYGLAYQVLGTYAPLGRGNYAEQGAAPELDWQSGLYGARFDNTIEYSNNFGPLKGQLQYSSGGVAGATSIGSTTAAALTYAQGPLSIGGVYQQSKDANSNLLKLWGVGGSYGIGPVTAFLSYFDAKRDPGFAAAANLSGGPLANTVLIPNTNSLLQRDDQVWTTGAVWQATPNSSYTLGFMHDGVKDGNDLGNNGRVNTVYAVADYSLSKRTDLYAEIDHTKLGGSESTSEDVLAIPGANQRTGIAAGMRVRF